MNEASPAQPYLTILGTPVHRVTKAQTLALVEQWIGNEGLHQIVTTNPEFVVRAGHDRQFRDVLWRADLCIPDGNGLVWASRWYGQPLAERVPGSELVYHLAKLCASRRWRLFLLGAGPGVAEAAAGELVRRYPQLEIAGVYSGSPALAENEAIVARINRSQADVLYVAYGAPGQDIWIDRNKTALRNVRVAIGVGGALDFISGRRRRAPSWMQRLGIEWLFRLIQEPWRWRRMMALPRFALAAFREGAALRESRRRSGGLS